jgi:hypothetical protein
MEHTDSIDKLPYGNIDKIITSPPYGEAIGRDAEYYEKIDTANKKRAIEMYGKQLPSYADNNPDNIGNLRYGNIDTIITSPPFKEQMQDTRWVERNIPRKHRGKHNPQEQTTGNVGNLKYGSIEAIITSPPYGIPSTSQESSKNEIERRIKRGIKGAVIKNGEYHTGNGLREQKYSDNPENLGNLPYGSIDSIITSPPYEEARQSKPCGIMGEGRNRQDLINYSYGSWQHGKTEGNIGNLKAQSYLEAMAAVYSQAYSVLKPGGLMVLVVKNFLRRGKEIPLDVHTIQLCKSVGFSFIERYSRILTQQSFWRIVYARKYPNNPVIDKEHILIFKKV